MANRLGFAVFFLAVLFLAFIAGAMIMVAEIYPYETLRNAYRAGEALLSKETDYQDPLTTDLWREARTDSRGVTINEDEQTAPGYTLYTSGDGPYAKLIARNGTVVHEWRKPFSEVWHENAAVKTPQPDELIYLDMARLLPNGDLLAIYAAVGDTPWGYGLVKLDRDSNVLWSYLEHAHHDFDIAADGAIYVLTHAFTNEVIEHFERLDRPRLDDFLVVLSPEGEELRRVSLTHALVRSRYKSLLYSVPYFALGDPLHTNAVQVLDEAKAANFPFGQPGQVLLSFREPGMVALLDLEREEIVWATRGPWLGQHDPNLLDNGHILLFDNLGVFEEGNDAQVIEFDPATLGTVWRYTGEPGRPFESDVRSSAERLPNGNTLITESDGGRIFEVTPAGRTVWEFVNPVRAGEGERYIPVVSAGQRVDPETLDPEFRAVLQRMEQAAQR